MNCFRHSRASAIVILALPLVAVADDWPQWHGPQRDGVWRESGIVERFPPGGPKTIWRTPIGAGYSGPAVAGNRVFVSDRLLKDPNRKPGNPFAKTEIAGIERILCLDATSGKVLWKHQYDCPYRISYPSGPRATPLVADGKVYVLGAMGNLWCLDAENGRVVWSRDFVKDFGSPIPMWGFAAHPLLDGDRLIVLAGGDGSVVVALNKDTGKETWRNLSSSLIGYCPPGIIEFGGARQLIIWDPEAIHSLDPVSGRQFWSIPFEVRAELSIPQPRLDGDMLFITSFYNSALMLRLDRDKPGAKVAWRGKGKSEQPDKTDTLHSIMPTPVFRDGHIYGVCSYGQLRCLDAKNGARIWETMAATRAVVNGTMTPADPKPGTGERWGNAFITRHEGRYILFNEHGDLILAEMSPAGYLEIDRANIIQADDPMAGRNVVWTNPAFAHRCVFVRNNKEIVCVSLSRE